MKPKAFIAAAAIAVLTRGAASAMTHQPRRADATGGYAAPAQPIPYVQLSARLDRPASRQDRQAVHAQKASLRRPTGAAAHSTNPA
jgi:hypothetical protein